MFTSRLGIVLVPVDRSPEDAERTMAERMGRGARAADPHEACPAVSNRRD